MHVRESYSNQFVGRSVLKQGISTTADFKRDIVLKVKCLIHQFLDFRLNGYDNA